MSQNDDVNTKLDKILNKMESMEHKMDARMNTLEQQFFVLKKKSHKQEKSQEFVLSEVAKLKARLNQVEQDKLINNLIIRGVKEHEKSDKDLEIMVDLIMSKLNDQFMSSNVVSSRRIGAKKTDKPRIILVTMINKDAKLEIIQKLKEKNLDNSQFSINGLVWGTSNEKIFLSDHLTNATNNIFYQARQLKKGAKIKYAWSKLGRIYVKKNDESRAIHVTSVDQLSQFDKNVSSDDDEVTSYSGTDDMEVETEVESTSKPRSSSRLKRKLNRTNSDPMHTTIRATKRSPRPKRVKPTGKS